MITLLPDHEWYANGSEALLCRLPFGMAAAEARLGLRFPVPGAGGAAHAVLQIEGYVLRLQAQADGSVVVALRGDVQTPAQGLSALCRALALAQEQLPWVAEELGPKPWLLLRVDDNGNRMPMWYFREREAAEAVARDYAARGHRQTYEVEQGAAAPMDRG